MTRFSPPVVVAFGVAVLTATSLGSLGAPFATTAPAAGGAALAVGVVVVGLRVLMGEPAAVAPALAALVLSVIGCLTAERLAPGGGAGQAAALALGLVVFLGVAAGAATPRHAPSWVLPATTAVALLIFALALVPGIGGDVGGARIGVVVGGLALQPAEIARPLLAAVLAARWANAMLLLRRSAHPLRMLVLATLPLGPAAALLVLADDRGPLLVLGVTTAVLVVAARPGSRVAALALGAPALVTGAALLVSSTLRERVAQMADPDADGLLTNVGAGLRSIARGGWFGTGVGRGHPESVRFVGSDFVLTHLAEERGAIVVLVVIALLAVVVHAGWRAAGTIEDPVRRSVATAMVLLLAVQSTYTCAGVLGAVPLTGLTLPFVSRGGSSLVGLWLTLALVVGLGGRQQRSTPVPRPAGSTAGRRGCDAAFTAVALLLVGVVLAPPVAAGTTLDVDWARHRGALLAVDGTVLATTSPDGTGRTYPLGRLASDVVGFTRPGAGAGLELSERARLSCEPSWWQRALGTDCRAPAVVTSLSPTVQRAAAESLTGQVGDVVAIDLMTHGLLAGFSTDRAGAAAPAFASVATSPGSTFKLVTATAALENGVPTDTPVRIEYTAPGGTRPVRNAGGVPGGGALEPALAQSSNTAFGEIATRTGTGPLTATTARLLTWETPPGPGPLSPEAATVGAAPTSPDALTRTGFGQEGVRVTPLAMAVLGATIADDGVAHAPRTVLGSCTAGDPVPPDRRVMTGATAARLQTAMAEVADALPALASVPGGAGAKTGTAQRPDGSTDGLVVAYAPREHPRVAVAVRVEPGSDGTPRSGGADAGPVAAAVLRAAFAPPGGDSACPTDQNR